MFLTSEICQTYSAACLCAYIFIFHLITMDELSVFLRPIHSRWTSQHFVWPSKRHSLTSSTSLLCLINFSSSLYVSLHTLVFLLTWQSFRSHNLSTIPLFLCWPFGKHLYILCPIFLLPCSSNYFNQALANFSYLTQTILINVMVLNTMVSFCALILLVLSVA